MSTPIKWGSEFLVNTTTANDQSSPTITALADGRFVVSWTNSSATDGDTSGSAIRAQIFNADGSTFDNEFLVNTTTTDFQDVPTITALADGGFVIAWNDASLSGGDTDGSAVRGQIYGADGNPAGTEFLIPTTTLDNQLDPTITALVDGGFVVAWTDGSQTGGDTDAFAVRAQIFKQDGSPSGTEFLVNTATSGDQSKASIAALTNGGFVVTWRDASNSGGDTDLLAVRAQIFNADGSVSGGEFLVNTTTVGPQFAPAVVGLADGRFVVAWQDNSLTGDDTDAAAIRAQIFNADGTTFRRRVSRQHDHGR